MSTESRRLWWLAAVTVLGLVAPPASAQIYKWVDKHGTIHFADTPPVTVDAGVTVETRSSEPPPPIVRGGPSFETDDDADAYDDRSVVAYPEPWPQDEPGDEGWGTVSSAGAPFVTSHHPHRDRRFGRHAMQRHGSGTACTRQQQMVPPQTTARTQSLNRPTASSGAPQTGVARSSTRGSR